MPQLLTFSKVLCAGLLLRAALSCATVTGQVEVASQAHRPHGLTDVVIWLEPEAAALAPPVQAQSEHARLLQKNKSFQPHVLIVRTGTIIDFPNEDPIFHNAFSTYDGQLFDVGLYPPGTNQAVRLRRPGVVRVFCNIHPSMAAVIVVVDTPYFTKVSAQGEYRFANVPAGAYLLNAYDERARRDQNSRIAIEVTGTGQDITAPPIRLSEAGYVHGSHKNKFGLDYPPGSDNPNYDGVMK